MTYAQLQTETRRLLLLEGWGDAPSPDYASLVNEALSLFSWESEYMTDSGSVSTVAGTAEYTLTLASGAVWKIVKDAWWGQKDLDRQSEDEVRERDAKWRLASNAQPDSFFMVRANVIRLYPPPDSVQTLTYYGIRSDDPLVNSTDTPACPIHYHRAIPRLAAWLHGEGFAKGESAARLQTYFQEAMQQANDFKLWLAEQNQMGLQRTVRRRRPQRVSMTGADATVTSN